MQLSTLPGQRIKALETNAITTSFAALNEQVTQPSGVGVLNIASKNLIMVWPFGTDANNETFNIRLVGWWPGNTSWGYSVLFDGVCTLSTEVGVASGEVLDTDFLCDTITRTAGVSSSTLQATTANTPAMVSVDTLGCSFIQFQFDLVTAASANAMYALI